MDTWITGLLSYLIEQRLWRCDIGNVKRESRLLGSPAAQYGPGEDNTWSDRRTCCSRVVPGSGSALAAEDAASNRGAGSLHPRCSGSKFERMQPEPCDECAGTRPPVRPWLIYPLNMPGSSEKMALPEDGRVLHVDQRRGEHDAAQAALVPQHGMQRHEAAHRLRALPAHITPGLVARGCICHGGPGARQNITAHPHPL